MRKVENYIWIELNGLLTLVVSENYKGHPQIMFEYDQIIISKRLWEKYKNKLVFKKAKHPKVIICNQNPENANLKWTNTTLKSCIFTA